MTFHRACKRITQIPLVEKERLILLEHRSFPDLFNGFVLLKLWFSVECFADRCLSLWLFYFWSLYILSVLLWFTDSRYPFSIFKPVSFAVHISAIVSILILKWIKSWINKYMKHSIKIWLTDRHDRFKDGELLYFFRAYSYLRKFIMKIFF